MRNEVSVNGAAVTIPMEAVESVNARFVNTLYGYFIGDRLAFPLVENYVKNTWANVLENGPWLIRRVPLLLNEWTSNTILKKDEIKRVPVWVKMHHVPIVAYSDVGLSLISTQIGKPLMLDSYTSNMCLNSWGRSAYVRVLIEIAADVEQMKSLIIAIPVGNKEGHTFATIDIKYEWTPPRCASCRIFDHVSKKCPKLPKVASNEKVIEVKRRRRKLKRRDVDEYIIIEENSKAVNNNQGQALPLKCFLMINVSAWNIRGMNLSPKQNEVRQVIYENKLSVSAILESHVATRNLERLCKHVFKNWNWISNAMSCLKGTRIIVGWNQNDVDVAVIHQDPQVIHTRIWIKADRKEFFCSFVYAFNKYIHRRPLWKGLCLHKNYINNRPWCLLGGFNAPLFVEDTSIGSSSLDVTMREFKECVENMEVMDVQRTGLQYTWNQKPKGKDGILCKLDRVLANLEFLDVFMGAHAVFKPYRISDHSPVVLSIPSLVKKLKGLKKPIRKLMYDKGNLHDNVIRLREELDKVQTNLDSDLRNFSLREKEAVTVADFNEALLMEEKFLKQKAKITWLKEGDSNTAYFHKVVKNHVSRSRIDVVTDAYGNVHHSTEVAKAFTNHYETFLGQPGNTSDFSTDNLFPSTLNESEAINMGKRGLRQGDPLSPYLFTLIMEVFTLMLKRRVSETFTFTYHRFCSELDLINLCFVDDLFLFAHGDVNLANVIKDALDDFKDASDRLSVKYLSVPLVSSQLISRDYSLWIWPNDWLVKYPILNSIPTPVISDDNSDSLEWRCRDGMGKPFSVHNVWDSIHPRDNPVPWCDLVWFHACIPRHAFNMWLIFKQRLRTQDCLRSWEVNFDLAIVCPLCETRPDSHEHLFFDCPFSQQVWSRIQQIAGLTGAGPSLATIITHLLPIAKRKSSKSCIGKLVVAATTYFIWHEHNSWLFNKVKRSVTEVVDCILFNVRLKLLSCRFKKSRDAIMFARLWKIPIFNLK
uniref:Reverse transcriptase domain-containing protein n=1 Tax=Tanacetum cinerariifolium TaxID=118510 RepID=A0A699GJW1_TANCI|nr:hypothetical protein [Tanacetum cinerariifolium]